MFSACWKVGNVIKGTESVCNQPWRSAEMYQQPKYIPDMIRCVRLLRPPPLNAYTIT